MSIEKIEDPQMDSSSGLFTVGGYCTLVPNRYWAVSIGVPGKSDMAKATGKGRERAVKQSNA